MSNENSMIKNTFGLNIALPKRTIQEVKKVVKQEFENISANPFMNYLDENNKVFSGEVAQQIRKYQAQIYSLGQIMREGQPVRTFRANG